MESRFSFIKKIKINKQKKTEEEKKEKCVWEQRHSRLSFQCFLINICLFNFNSHWLSVSGRKPKSLYKNWEKICFSYTKELCGIFSKFTSQNQIQGQSFGITGVVVHSGWYVLSYNQNNFRKKKFEDRDLQKRDLKKSESSNVSRNFFRVKILSSTAMSHRNFPASPSFSFRLQDREILSHIQHFRRTIKW